jgi:hypothetical protein
MPSLTRNERESIARYRLQRILAKHVVANSRTLEQKISDAGPAHQRIDPHILTSVRKAMVSEGQIVARRRDNIDWYALPEIDADLLEQRLKIQAATFKELQRNNLSQRMGQTLEIATFKALQNKGHHVFRTI